MPESVRRLGLRYEYQNHDWLFGLEGRWHDEASHLAPNALPTDSYTLWNADVPTVFELLRQSPWICSQRPTTWRRRGPPKYFVLERLGSDARSQLETRRENKFLVELNEDPGPSDSLDQIPTEIRPIGVSLLSFDRLSWSRKTTVLNYLLRNSKGRRLAVLVNDVGEVNIDAALARDVAQVDSGFSEDIVELSNGCICCAIQDAFGKAVMELAKRNPDCIVVEATGIAEPLRIIESLAALNDEGLSALEFVRIANLVTLVDANWWVKKIQEIYSPVRRPLMLFSDLDDP